MKKSFVMTVLAILSELLLFLLKDTIIINIGISMYRTVGYAIHALFVILIVSAIAFALRNRKDAEIKASLLAQQERDKEAEKDKASYLSVKKELDPAELQYLLNKRNRPEEPPFVQRLYATSLHQMKLMDSYQEKLNNLIVANGADGLADSKNILDQCEQYICRNVRKIMNKAELSFSDTGMDDPEYEQILQANENVLDKVNELMHSIVDFLNNQGDSTNEITMLDMYKSTIQDILSEKRR